MVTIMMLFPCTVYQGTFYVISISFNYISIFELDNDGEKLATLQIHQNIATLKLEQNLPGALNPC